VSATWAQVPEDGGKMLKRVHVVTKVIGILCVLCGRDPTCHAALRAHEGFRQGLPQLADFTVMDRE
jgi:hypothetical protein